MCWLTLEPGKSRLHRRQLLPEVDDLGRQPEVTGPLRDDPVFGLAVPAGTFTHVSTEMTSSAASQRWFRSLFLVASGLAVADSASAQSLTVPNGSFELPSTTFVDTRIDLWTKTPQPSWFDPAATGGIGWDQLSGVFANTAVGQPSHIDNVDGNQAIFVFALPQVGISQVLSTPEGTFQPGSSYTLTVGLLAGGGAADNSMFQVGLFYLDGSNTAVPINSTTAEFTTAAFPTSTHLIDQTVSTPVVQPGDAWAGKPIGIALTAVSGTGSIYWDVDNVRLTQTAVPEPTTMALFGLGMAGVLWGVRAGRRSK